MDDSTQHQCHDMPRLAFERHCIFDDRPLGVTKRHHDRFSGATQNGTSFWFRQGFVSSYGSLPS